MITAVKFIQLFSAVTTALAAIGWWGTGVPEFLQKLGVEVTHLQIAFTISIVLLIATTVQKQRQHGRDRKSQIQIGGRHNRQDMK